MKKTLQRLGMVTVGLSLCLWSCDKQGIEPLKNIDNNSIVDIVNKYSLKRDSLGTVTKENSFNFKTREELETFLSAISKRDTIRVPLFVKKSNLSSAKILPYDDGNDYFISYATVFGGGSFSACNNFSAWQYEYDSSNNTWNYVLKFRTACGLGSLNANVNYAIRTIRNRNTGMETKSISPNSLTVSTVLTGATLGVSIGQGQTTANGYDSRLVTFSTDLYVNYNVFIEGAGTVFTQYKKLTGSVNSDGFGYAALY